MLTHLNVAFGYITSDFKITNMDGVSTTMYKNAAAVKSKNPNLKVLIALGGWSFSDPGNWQSVFPTMASTASNRATFINNLLGWLSEYGYDGVDFDWEYPGADDRGGSEGDGENFTALLKELRTAINASGKEYIVTFTAPSSYWYLRHFDITNMVGNVDWINLMSYDLHGVWDSNNPIGNQVIAHTNLTEIDLALDLFWRNNIEPSKIVLGLGFYGRSFELSSPSCWRPGCEFSGPGAEGVCTKTAGILSYREISGIIDQTGGGKPYFDEVAAVKYMVYNGNSWISYDDADTFKLKIAYANTIGLGGLMIWAIDQDDTRLTALRAVTDSSLASDDTAPFTLVDLHRLWSIEDYPTDDSNPRYGLVNFGGEANMGETNPDKTGFGFFIVAGYWNDIVDSEGIESSDVKRLTERFFSRDTIYWTEKFGSLSLDESRELNVEQSLTQSLYWDSINECSVDGSEFGEGIGAYIDGNIKARFEYGFSLGAVIQDGKLLVQTTNGVLYAEGYSDLTYTVGGVGRIDVAQAKNGNPSWYAGEKTPITAHTVYASGMKGWASYKPSSGTPSGVDIADPRISIPQSNVIYGSGPGLDTAKIALACYFSFGLDVDFGVQQNGRDLDWEGPDIKLRFESSAEFTNDASSGSGTCVDYRIATVERVWIEDP
ncbi:putative bacteriodes thetaiotaomicron symbiotic protein [Phaeoacremonium minimum UCRPA7]|uniref:chitinase n=1 Tax=Phaeoacremonium minimum (strain UCR-PA7) TaxID=1286976 RepID=R8BCS1_PHAM7|nr:putative bacteriodes thetaiotaomicron symbiotic protein [Phaeoacremonium minimum UCRPA7]EON97103.1 putative bacteriodes thetaiotaomicron symbiotic protein [Phaeoacremonium minimum UCRPA7]